MTNQSGQDPTFAAGPVPQADHLDLDPAELPEQAAGDLPGPLPQDESGATVIRSEERLRSVSTERVPVERVRLVRHIITEQVTRTFELRREELRVEVAPLGDGEAASVTEAARSQPLEIVLSGEEVEFTTRVVPKERVRVHIERIANESTVTAQLRREQIAVEPVGAVQPVPDEVARKMERG